METGNSQISSHLSLTTDPDRLPEALLRTLAASIAPHLGPGCGVLFSGGVDSALVARLSSDRMPEIPLCTVGFPDSHDVAWAKTAAGSMGLLNNLHIRFMDLDEMGALIPRVIAVLRTTDPLTISLGIPLYVACTEAKKHNITMLLAGQGADELFGGYHRYRDMAQSDMNGLHRAMTADVDRLPQRDIRRDTTVARAAGVNLAAPFLDAEIIALGLSIPPELKVREVQGEWVGKYILRRAAAQVVPDEIAWRDKKALQYGSGVWGVLGKLARVAGFTKQDKGYIRKYLYSVAEENRITLDGTS